MWTRFGVMGDASAGSGSTPNGPPSRGQPGSSSIDYGRKAAQGGISLPGWERGRGLLATARAVRCSINSTVIGGTSATWWRPESATGPALIAGKLVAAATQLLGLGARLRPPLPASWADPTTADWNSCASPGAHAASFAGTSMELAGLEPAASWVRSRLPHRQIAEKRGGFAGLFRWRNAVCL